jgi:hypothetical protein
MTDDDGTLHGFMEATGRPIQGANIRVCWNLDCPEAGYLVEPLGDGRHECPECGKETESAEDQLDAAR